VANVYDVIVVGARCAGAPVAMLLARQGYRVLVVDRATFPSDTISTHLIHPPGVARLQRWGLLDRLVATGCPPIDAYAFDLGPFTIEGSPGSPDSPVAYAPRRTVLDMMLVEAAASAGADVREAFVVEAIVQDGGRVTGIRGHGQDGRTVTESAEVVVGADGIHSTVARTVAAVAYRERPPLQASYYSYWSGLPMNGRFEAFDRGKRAFAAWPTHDDLTLVIAGWPMAEFERNRTDIERHVMSAIELAPAFAQRLRAARREERFVGTAVPNHFRKPFGPGWALVGDAGYNKDFITAQGISDAFRDADLCATALHESLSGTRSYDDAMGAYQATRDGHSLPMFEFTCEFAEFAPAPPERQQLMAAVHGNPDAMNGFARVFAGTTSPAEFFAPANVERIVARAGGSGV
jgi:2-polyprenyl-6-methoxyphenol hydroxylase-like FAD-dependent oxidoreductase